ncbi:ferric reductase-like transmembrane domain-containing protein [filamentous cyanobacterium LEGE 11480]|uniref:Ferric reductase-like transmembrane domain-containing protein n=1 Tax=Romeriopsis navalis LEGE 11480 TaxID=2777977 RepID=A0A928Z3Q9_9CYAN|nr:Rieske 2Fe-2S domain-containing protein [Romeriopsis navalis]MBE9030272.1 ferric reductase-like transmembrane domain-containing protein [Romeriopsis navalis LEGE 11480]
MSVAYKSIQWNRTKIIYDLLLFAAIGIYLFLFTYSAKLVSPDLEMRGLDIRAFGSAAFILLHVILSIGPLCRFDRRFLPLLYNRRHMGVTMFFLGLIHVIGFNLSDIPVLSNIPYKADGALYWYHDFGNVEPIVSLFAGNTHYGSLVRFPFETLGVIGLAILFLMAITSHDFWLANLTAPIWKALHMSVYVAYAALVGHVTLGAIQTNRHPFLTIAVGLGLVWITVIHLLAALQERRRDRAVAPPATATDHYVDIGSINEIPDTRAKIVTIAGERVAIFKYDGKIAAISNVCQHQNGPLGEGKVIDGCVTCPWHGYQYLPETGASPPPFIESVPTFNVQLRDDRIFVSTIPNPPGTETIPARIYPDADGAQSYE